MTIRTTHRPVSVLLICCAALLMQFAAEPASAKRKLPRPSATIVKQVITENWDTDRTGPNYTELTFHKITIGKTRRRHVYERAPSYYVTPVRVVFTQTITYAPGKRDVARITQNALFYKGEFDWTYHSKGAKVVYLERM